MQGPGTYLNSTLAYCSSCGRSEHARIVERGGMVWMDRACPVKGIESTPLSISFSWYQKRASFKTFSAAPRSHHEAKNGCPLDCGICSRHLGGLHLAVFSITNDCNLDCPKCFTFNRPDMKYYKTPEETRAIVRHILQTNPKIQLLNITGGEPTLHPDLESIFKVCREEGVPRITMNTNGLLLARKPSLASLIKTYDVQIVLSMDTLTPDTSSILYGRDILEEKFKALDILKQFDISTTLLIVAAKEINSHEISPIVSRYIREPFIRSFTIQNMTFTGKNGQHFTPRKHLTLDEVEEQLCKSPFIRPDDFFTPGSSHPLCYSSAYFLILKSVIFPLSRLIPVESLRKHTQNRYLIEPDTSFLRDFMDGINRLWAEGCEEETILELKSIFSELHTNSSAPEKERRSKLESITRIILVHPHMDEDNFDLDRISRCGDLVPDEKGTLIPACAYNLLYRQKDTRFWVNE